MLVMPCIFFYLNILLNNIENEKIIFVKTSDVNILFLKHSNNLFFEIPVFFFVYNCLNDVTKYI